MKINLVLLFCFVIKTLAKFDYLDNEVEFQCIKRCPIQNRTDLNHYDYACDFVCNIDQCAKGCKLWRKALNSTCQEACNGTTERLTSKELYCVMGCNDATTKYFAHLRARLGIPPAPALLADSRTATSIKLEWNFFEARRPGLSCHVQWKYEKLSSTWQYSRNATWDQENNTFFVNNLQPYTKYRFRIALILGYHGHHEDPVVSTPSVVISTTASGVPVSPPTNVRATPVDSTSISISWEPGPFPHGPLLSYVLQITDNYPEVHSEVKDIPPENTFYIVRNLRPSSNYTVGIRMRNSYGAGPAATTVVSTPAEPKVKNTQPVLILSTEYSIFELAHILGEPVTLYRSAVPIRGIGIHLSKKLLFVADSDGYISRMPLGSYSRNKTHILKPQYLDFMPLDLVVDWLNDQLYILGEVKYQISRYIINRCNLDGSSLTVAYAGLNKKPFSMQIDPLSGYLFWTIQDYNSGGLDRLDISDISNGIKHNVTIKRILNETELGAFTIDHTNFILFVSYQRENTIKSVTLSGNVLEDIRPAVTHSQLQKVISLAMANKKFYWTDGIDVFNEEYHKAYGSYFHNTIPHLTNGSYKKVFINLPSSQPWPVPINPPKQLQAIFGRTIAKTRWQPPELLGLQGKGAWQNWSYELSVTNLQSNKTFTHNNINTTAFTIDNLKENCEYILKVAAYTKAGKGPWSSVFQGTTLNSSRNPMILWSAAEGLLKSNAAGENVETIIHKTRMKNLHFTDITWFKDQIYLVSNDSHVYRYNLTSHQRERLVDIDSVGSIAVDWIGMKLYWSNPKQQLIIRSKLNGAQQEPLLTTLAKELNIDSVKGYLYWSTGIKVECAHLNGVNKIEYHDVHFFSGKQVMGLTLDMDEKFVYWIVRGSEGSNLYKGPMQGYWNDKTLIVQKVSSLKESNMQGPLCYFHKRFLWLQDDKNAAISDLTGTNIATISGKSIWGLNMVYVVDSSLHMLPEGIDLIDQINVIPEVIDKMSIGVNGSSDFFNVTWNPVTNVNYGTVFYEVQINSELKNDSTIINTTTPSVKYWREVAPFTPLNVTLRAFTYWGTSPQVRAEIYSPPSTPSAPRNLRAYVIHEHKQPHASNYVSLIFRWDPPLNPNGVLQGFKLRCWYIENDLKIDICGENVVIKPDKMEYKVTQLDENKVYYFQVQAFTEIGSGIISDPISVNSSYEWPLPKLVIASSDSIFIDDIDANQNYPLVNDITTPVELSYLMKENNLFWINKKRELWMYNFLTSNLTKLFDINGKPNGLTLDWLERSLYYVETAKDTNGSVVYKIDLNHVDNEINKNIKILNSTSNISKIEVSPFTKKLYWAETFDGIRYILMQSDTDGSNIEPFFSRHDRNRRHLALEESTERCNCPANPEVGASFTIDHSETKTKPLIIFIDPYTLNVVSTDKEGCTCNVVANNTIVSNAFPLDRIKSDFGTLYWTNPSQGLLYALKRKEANILTKVVKVSDIVIYGQHMQPYPPKECLSPKQHDNVTVSLNYRTANSLNLRMPDLIIHEDCFNVSMATPAYTVFYRKYNEDRSNCSATECEQIVTFDKNVEISGLKSFTKYIVSVAVSNHFTEGDSVLIGPPKVFQTAPGVPSKPRNVSAFVLNPTLAKVHWLPPEHLNGLIVYYEIHWQTAALSGARQKGEQPVIDPHSLQDDSDLLATHLHKLSPNETYTVWVRAYSETNASSSDSDRVQITTYPEPASITLVNRTAYFMNLSWEIIQNINNYSVEYTPITSNDWIHTNTVEASNNILINVENLRPKTQYKFRLSLLYENDTELYVFPSDSRFTFETLGDRPSCPGMPIIQYVKPNVYKVWWEASKDNGDPIELYKLEGKVLISYRNKRSTNRTVPWFNTSPSIEIEEPEWETVYNGTETSWIISGLNEKLKYAFRVSALNAYGWSDTSEESNEFDLSEAARLAEKQNPMKLIIIATGVPISILFVVILAFAYVVCSSKGKQKKIQQMAPAPRAPDVELATLRELPRRGVHSTNVLYVSTQQAPEEITLLPHIRRDQITLTKFLGSGAFGEVFEGRAKGIGNDSVETKVAVKTLKKGASDQEKTEFLQEAQLMSHFKHEHILQLLGVCLDNDPHFIIMELMQGGDLLTYLRDSRNPATTTPSLTLIELLKMCVDVSKGCRYLEEMHFVHRDLACRNCLVSSIEKDSRIVKIGDFGLARDIYKNDYYRKEGEGLLPVRWMAPESLVDGVFTSQSDVWAFGVLLWEIMTLGQQPYPARANLEVLHYVKRGGRLGKPTDCPEELHNLMLKCWEFEPDKRPTFKYCLEVLENLHRQILRNPTTGAHEGQYISTVPERNSWKADDDDINKEKTPFLAKNYKVKEIPKYLELVYEPEPELENDGYEIPNQMPPSKQINEPSAKKSCPNVSNSDNSLIKNKDSDVVTDLAISKINALPYHNMENNLVKS